MKWHWNTPCLALRLLSAAKPFHECCVFISMFIPVSCQQNHLEDCGVGGRIILKSVFKKSVERSWTGLIWRRIGTGGGLL
jgi:hypothetical protein